MELGLRLGIGQMWVGFFRKFPSQRQCGGGSQTCSVSSATRAEMFPRRLFRIVIFIDSAQLVSILSRHLSSPVAVSWLFLDLLSFIRKFSPCLISKVPYSEVSSAHSLAHSARTRESLHLRF